MNRFLTVFILAAALSPAARAQADREIVKVNGTPIRQSEVLERLWKRYGPETLDEMVDELLLRQAAQSKGAKAEPSEIERRLSRYRSQFPDPKVFESQLEQYGTSLEKLKGDIAEQIARERLVAKERGLSIGDEELKKAFEAHREELGAPAGVHLRHILVKTEAEAKDLIEKIKGGADFVKLARENSLAPTGKLNGGDYGFVSKGMLPPDIEQTAFAMKPNELRIFPTPKGFHILQTLERREAVPADYNKIKNDLREMLLQEKYKAALPEYLKELRRKAEIKPQGQ